MVNRRRGMHVLRRLFFNFMYTFRQPRWDTGISPPELLEFIHDHPPGRALDLGCGTGTNLISLARAGWQVSGVDFAGRAIREARRKARQAGVQVDLRLGDVTRLEGVGGPFNLILDIGCYHGLSAESQQAYVDNLGRLLAEGGYYLLYAFFRAAPEHSRPGVVESDLQRIARRLELVKRVDSSERGQRLAAWLTFRKQGAGGGQQA